MAYDELNILRCNLLSCNKKLTLTNNFECLCGNFYCIKHKFSLDHDCPFDYKNKQRELLQKKLIKIDHEKIVKI
jgi:predicted nucleic acid binding AN1-type Zn finger protein